MIPEFVRCVKEVMPKAFVAENVAGLTSKKFKVYLEETLFTPLNKAYDIQLFTLNAAGFGVPQIRKRVIFVGIRKGKEKCMGVREALGLEDTKYDTLAPTLRCTLTGPRSTTSILSSTSAQKVWQSIDIWPNGVQATREKASAFETKDGSFRLSVADCAVLQPMAYHIALSLAQILSD